MSNYKPKLTMELMDLTPEFIEKNFPELNNRNYDLSKYDPLPSDYREQKTREQNDFLARADKDPNLARSVMAFKDVMTDCVVKIISDPEFDGSMGFEEYVY